MPALEDKRLEALAQGLANGLSIPAATRAAGYSRQYNFTRERARRPAVVERVAEIREEEIDAAVDLRPVIGKLLALVDVAGELKGAAGLREARLILTEVARLKQVIADEIAHTPITRPPRLEMSTEEWIATFAPKEQ